MTYQSRSSRLKSLPHHDDSIYWSAHDTFSNVTDHTRPISRQSVGHHRNYIDPWDLENYAYIQSMESPEPNGTPVSSNDSLPNVYYVSNNAVEDNCPCYAGLDEQLFYNAKYEMIPDDGAYSTFTEDAEMSSAERNSSCSGSSTVSTLQLHTPGFGTHSRRSIVLPKPIPHIEFPAPPPPVPASSAYECYANIGMNNYESLPSNNHFSLVDYTQYHYDQLPLVHRPVHPHRHQHHRIREQCHECMELYNVPLYHSTKNSIRDDYNGYATVEQRRYLERFGLSKKGLLQIDYSFNWVNLQRIIASK